MEKRFLEPFDIPAIRAELAKGPAFYTLQEAADMLKVGYITIYRRVIIGDIDASMVAGCWRITATALRDYLEKRHPFNLPEK